MHLKKQYFEEGQATRASPDKDTRRETTSKNAAKKHKGGCGGDVHVVVFKIPHLYRIAGEIMRKVQIGMDGTNKSNPLPLSSSRSHLSRTTA
jgi:hypothetical protein